MNEIASNAIPVVKTFGEVGLWLAFCLYVINKIDNKLNEKLKELGKAHQEAIASIKEIAKTMTSIEKILAVHAKELEHGGERFAGIEKQLELLNKENRLIRDDFHRLKQDVVTVKNMEVILQGIERNSNQ